MALAGDEKGARLLGMLLSVVSGAMMGAGLVLLVGCGWVR